MKFTKRNKTLALALALLVLLVTLTAGMGFAAAAADDAPKFNLSVTFDSETAVLYYSLDEGTEREMESGKVYEIVRGTMVKIRVQAKDGYTVKGAGGLFETVGEGEQQRIPNKESGETSYIIPTFNEHHTYTARCVNRSFDIDFCPSSYAPAGETSLDYTFEGGAPDLTVTYDSDAVLIPTPKKEGYLFLNWTMVNSSGEDLGLKEVTSSLQLNNEQLLVRDILDTGMIYLRANFIPQKYLVTRIDYVFDANNPDGNRGDELGRYFAEVDMDSVLQSATWGGSAEGENRDPGADGYLGYKLHDGAPNHSIKVNVTDQTHANLLLRFYDPIVYTLRFDANGGTEVAAGTHTFNADTALPTSSRIGYTFVGWTVTVDGVEVGTVTVGGNGSYILAGKNTAYAATEIDSETGMPVIRLTAKWEADRYGLVFDAAGGTLADGTPTEHVYDGNTVIPDPIRKGYAFLGWYINGSEELLASENGFFTLDPTQMPPEGETTITLQAKWEAKTFTVVLGGNAGTDPVEQLEGPLTLTFDAPMPNISQTPTRVGYRFCGFATEEEGGTLYIDAEGNGIGSWQEDGVTTLYAQWEALPYSVIFSTNNSEFIDFITVNGERYELDSLYTIRFRETVEVRIVTKSGYKLVMWKGGAETHSADFTASYQQLVAETREVQFIVLPVIAAPEFTVDYQDEAFVTASGAIPAGVYSVYDSNGNFWRRLEVDANGNCKLDGVAVNAVSIPENFFGTTVSIIRHGANGAYADSDAIRVPVSARPAAPTVGLELPSYHREIWVKVNAVEGDTSRYQFAISSDASGENLIWQDHNIFTDLEPGTPYYIYVRIRHTETEPHSVPTAAFRTATTHEAYIHELEDRLDALRHSEDGANVDAVIRDAKDALQALQENAPYASFYADAEALVAAAEERIPLARLKDRQIAALSARVEQMVAGNTYDDGGKAELAGILQQATEQISAAENEQEVQQLYKAADRALDLVKITYITVSDPLTKDTVQITGNGGLDPNSDITLARYPDLKALIEKVDAAIENGRINVYQNGMTVLSALDALRTQDVMAAYRFSLVSEGGADSYVIRVLIPTDLRDVQALRVGYYNEDTQTLEILSSHIDGDHIVFESDRIADFLIFGDPTVTLTAVIIALAAILLLQLIAILFLVICRRRAFKRVRSYCIAPVGALTIRFLPANGLVIVLALAAAVVVCTVILVWLLFTTDLKRRGDEPDGTAPTSEYSQEDPIADENVLSVFDEADQHRDTEPALTTLTDTDLEGHPEEEQLFSSAFARDEEGYRYSYETDGEETEEVYNDEAETVYDDSDAVYDDTETVYDDDEVIYEEDTEAIYEEEPADEVCFEEIVEEDFESGEYPEEALFADYDGEDDFIEPSANPMYSLPEGEYPAEAEQTFAQADPEAEQGTSDEMLYTVGDAYFEEQFAPSAQEESDAVIFPDIDEEDERDRKRSLEDVIIGEEELSDIDDSYLAEQSEGEEELPDIDDSKR